MGNLVASVECEVKGLKQGIDDLRRLFASNSTFRLYFE